MYTAESFKRAKVTTDEKVEMFKTYLAETNPPVWILGLKYDAGFALQQCDPIAFTASMHDWINSEICEGNLVEIDNELYNPSKLEQE